MALIERHGQFGTKCSLLIVVAGLCYRATLLDYSLNIPELLLDYCRTTRPFSSFSFIVFVGASVGPSRLHEVDYLEYSTISASQTATRLQ